MGRPKGSKNKSTLSRLAKLGTPLANKASFSPGAKKIGRPAKTVAHTPPGLPTGIKPPVSTMQKKRGRPSKFAATQTRTKTGTAQATGRRGRPPKSVVTAKTTTATQGATRGRPAAPANTGSFATLENFERILTNVLSFQSKEVAEITSKLADGITQGVANVLKSANVGKTTNPNSLVITEADNGWVVEYPSGNKTARAAFEAEEDTDEACAYAFSRLLEFVGERTGPRLTNNSFEVAIAVVDNTASSTKRVAATARDDDPVEHDNDVATGKTGNTGVEANTENLPLAASGAGFGEEHPH